MAATDTTTIRVPIETRDRLNSLAARRGEPAGDVVAKLVNAADEEAMLAEAAADFERIAADPRALSAIAPRAKGSSPASRRLRPSGRAEAPAGRRVLGRSRTDSWQGAGQGPPLRDRLGRSAESGEPRTLPRRSAHPNRLRQRSAFGNPPPPKAASKRTASRCRSNCGRSRMSASAVDWAACDRRASTNCSSAAASSCADGPGSRQMGTYLRHRGVAGIGA